MQNPFRHQDQPGRRDDDERHPQGGDWRAERRPDEYRSWGGGDDGRTAEAFRHQGPEQGYGQHQQSRYGQGPSTGWTGGYAGPGGYATGAQSYGGGPQYGQDFGGQGYGPQNYGSYSRGQSGGLSEPYGSPMTRGYADPARGGQPYGQGPMGQGYASHGYAPGSQIWEGSGRGMGGQTHEHHEFEPDYLHWREQQMSAFDKDYSDWRNERRQKFSSDFDSWRQSRPRRGASHHTPAENPIVGDVSDGGTGNAVEAKRR